SVLLTMGMYNMAGGLPDGIMVVHLAPGLFKGFFKDFSNSYTQIQLQDASGTEIYTSEKFDANEKRGDWIRLRSSLPSVGFQVKMKISRAAIVEQVDN